MQVTNLFTHLHLTKPFHNFTFNCLYLGCRLLSLFIPFQTVVLCRVRSICAQTDEVCVFCGEGLVLCCVVQSTDYLCTNWWSVCVSGEGLVLCCTEHRISVHKLMKCVCFVERALCCVVQSTEYLHKLMKCVYFWRGGPCGSVCSVCVSGEGLVEVCVFLERALWKCVCFWREPCGSVCVSGESLVEVCVFLERALWKCVCFWREPCVVQICIPVQPRPAAASYHCVWLHLQDGHWLWGQAAAEDHDESQCYVGQYLPLTWGHPYLYRSTSL